MARAKKTDSIDLSQRHTLTAGAIERLTCPPDKAQAFMRDSEVPSLRVRVTPAGAKSFVFEAKLNRDTIRRTIGDVRDWDIPRAREEARRLAVMIDNGLDPREVERQQQAEQQAQKHRQEQAAQAKALTVGMAWDAYTQERRAHWGEAHRKDHERLTKEGGKATNRGTQGRGVTQEGILRPLLALPLSKLSPAVIEDWAKREGQTRPTVARLAWRLLRGFLNWCAEHPDYAPLLNGANPAKTKRTREALGKAQVKADSLLREQLPAWFAAVQAIQNPVISAYLQVLLLTGARPNEIRLMRWEDVGTAWRSLTIRDKVEGERMIPLTPYIHHLIASLPRRNEWVFSSDRTAASITEPNHAHTRACAVAGVDGLTLHGLRRSFKNLAEWLEIQAGVLAQLMGHKPSAIAERHYTVRPLDLLRVHHERIEGWVLEQAGIAFDSKAEVGRLRVVA